VNDAIVAPLESRGFAAQKRLVRFFVVPTVKFYARPATGLQHRFVPQTLYLLEFNA
jgi:hypothetical protein